nr:putative ribonuclease H-like domain-containing protein [Tanacetum cinerariifolium]
MINSRISVVDKIGLGYDSQMNESDLNDIHVNKSNVLNNVVDSHESDGDDNQVNDRFIKGEGYHAVPPPYTGNYMPPKADLSFVGLDNYVFKTKLSETITSVPKIKTNASKTSKDYLEKPKTIRPSATLIEEYELDSKDENVFNPKEVKKTVKPSLEKIKFVNARNTIIENENKVAVLTNSGQVTINAAKQSSYSAAASVSAARHAEAVNTACYVQNRVLVIKPYNKTPYELFLGRKPALSFMRPFGCPVIILNTLDHLGPKCSENEVANGVGKKSSEVSRKENEAQDPAKEGDKNDQEKDLRDQEEAPRNQFEQEFERLFGQWKASNTNSTNKLNTVSSPVNAVSSSFTTIDPGRERAQRNELESMFEQEKDANGNRMFTPVSAARSIYVNIGGSIPVNVAILPNADLLIDSLMPDLDDTAELQDFGMFEGAKADFNNLKLTTIVYRNKKDERGIVVRNKARLVTQGYTQKEGTEYDEVLLLLLGLKQSVFLAYASFMGFIVYQMDVKSAFLYGIIAYEVYECQPPGFEDPHFPNKFWQTTTTRTLDNGEMEITTTIDRKVKVVTEAAVRRHLKLEDSNGISILPTNKIFEQLALMGTFNFSKRIFDGLVKNLDSKHKFLMYPRFIQGEGSTVPVKSHYTPTIAPSISQPYLSSPPRSSVRQETKVPQPSSPTHTHVADEVASIGVDDKHGGAATTVTNLDVGQCSNRVLALETDLKQLKKVYSATYTKLTMKVKKLEKTIKTSQDRRKTKIVVGYEQDMEFNFDAAKEVSTAEQVSTAGVVVNTASADISPASPTRRVSTADDITMAETLVYIRRSAAKIKDKEERDKYNKVDQAKMLVDLINQRTKYFVAKRAEERRKNPITQAQQRTYMFSYIKHMGIHTMQQLRRISFDEIKELFETTMKRVNTFVPMETE